MVIVACLFAPCAGATKAPVLVPVPTVTVPLIIPLPPSVPAFTVTAAGPVPEPAAKPMANASEAILSLQPVTFRYKKELDPKAIPQFGLVAEQVAKVDPDLVARDAKGKSYTVRYEAVNAMLLNEFIKEHRKVEEQGTSMKAQEGRVKTRDGKIGQLEATVAKLQSALEKQATHYKRWNERLETVPTEPRLVENR
jgi:hypothetical protein